MISGPRQHSRVAVLLFIGLCLVYNANLRQVSSYDTYASRFVPISILRDGDLVLDEFFPDALGGFPSATEATEDDPGYFNYLVFKDGHLLDSHPLVGPLLALPIYALPTWFAPPGHDRLVANLFSKLAASVMAALSAVALLACVRRMLCRESEGTSRRRLDDTNVALMAALAYALGTPVWSTASQAMWSHTPAVLGYAVALWGLTASRSGIAGPAIGVAWVARPATAPAAVLLIAFAWHRAWRDGHLWSGTRAGEASRISVLAAATAALGMAYNFWLFGNPGGGASARTAYYGREFGDGGMFSGSFIEGLAGLTVSPSRGLLVFSPVVLLAVVGSVAAWQFRAASRTDRGKSEADGLLLARYASLAIVAVVLMYAQFIAWWGGQGFGSRYLADVMPFVGVLFGMGYAHASRAMGAAFGSWREPRSTRWSRRVFRPALATILVYSIAVQAVGAFCWPSRWTLDAPAHVQGLWDWRDSQIIACIRAGPRIDPLAKRLFSNLEIASPE